MRRTMIVLLSLLFAVSISSPALAARPHFIGQVSIQDLGTTVQASGSVAGLGNENIDVILTATGTASIDCRNPGGNVAPGQRTSVSVSGSDTDIEVENGRAFFNVTTLEPQDPDPAVVCPSGKWTAEITDVDFTSATLTVIQPSGSGNVVLQQTFAL